MRSPILAVLVSLSLSAVAFGQEEEAEEGGQAQAVDVSRLPFTPDSIKMVIGEAQPRIQSCYEQMLSAREKNLEGKLLTTFTITAEGTVKKARVERRGSTLQDGKLHQCVALVLDGLIFPKPPNGKSYPVEFPFNFKAIK